MTTLADRTITELRALHDELAALVATISDDQLTGPSGASEWTIAAVLSHLGSGSEIALASYEAALNGTAGPEPDFNQSVWDRWDAMSPQEQAAGFVEHDTTLVTSLESLTADQREGVRVKLGFLPAPLDLAAFAGMRLNEVALHSWDVRVAVDPVAGLRDDTAAVVADQLSGSIGFLLGFLGKAEALSSPAVVGANGLELVITDSVSLLPAQGEATAVFNGPQEALIRLIGGRLKPEHTPAGVEVDGNISLDELRRVFPGF